MNMIELHVVTGELMVKGDTFPHRALLKHMGFKWAPSAKVWHRTVHEQDTLDYLMKMFEVNGVWYTADATVKFNMIDEEKMRSIRQEMLEIRMRI